MKKITLLVALIWVGLIASAQTTITGIVKDAQGIELPGATVTVQGFSGKGTVTNSDGTYSIDAPQEATSLVFSFIGMKSKTETINGRTVINVNMENADIEVDEVIITALGVSREKSSLGYAVQKVSADDIAVKDPTSITNSLQGRVSGIQVKSGSGTVGGSSSIVIRGASSLGGTNQPLYVVDGTPISNYDFSNTTKGYDYGNGAQDINPDDVESISILKGAAATTLYGNRGANGVIVITTKSGNSNKGLGVEINSTTTFDNIYIFPDLQNEFGGGRPSDTGYGADGYVSFGTFDYAASGLGSEWASYDGTLVSNTGRDESWGPKLDGTQVFQWDSFVPESENYMQTRPWVAHEDNYKDLFNTGVTFSNSISLNGGSENSKFRLGFTSIDQSGIVPSSKLKKNMITFKGSTKLSERLEVFTSVNYIKQSTTGRSKFGYDGDGTTVPAAMRIWTQRQVDADLLEKYTYSDVLGGQVGWNLRNIEDGSLYIRWSNNPFWTFDNIYATDAKDRVYGNAGIKVDITDGLKFTATARTDFYSLSMNDRVGSGGTTTDYYGESTKIAFENNFDGIFNYNKNLSENLTLNAMFGGNMRYSQYKSNYIGTVDGLVIQDFYNVSNTSSPASSSSYFSERQTNSLFASASFGYKSFAYLDIAGRNDWSSTLPTESNSYYYPSVSTSFVFSELLSSKKILSFGKLRAGFAVVGNDTYAYRLYNSYDLTSFGSTTTFTINDARQNANLKNETTSEFEVGLETAFFNGKARMELTYFSRKTYDQIIGLDVSSTTGFSNAIINAGELQNTGIEAILQVNPIKTDNFSWNVLMNFSTYNSQLNSLYGDLEDYEISSVGSAWVMAEVGGEYGVMYASGGYEYDANGNKLVDENGYFVKSGKPEKVGSIVPEFNGGIMNTVTFKGISLSALVDFQSGGLIYSYANRYAASAGQTEATVAINELGNSIRMDPALGGGILEQGVFAPGTTREGETNDIYVDSRDHFRHLRNFQEEYMYDGSFIKLRELKLGYALPQSLVEKVKLGSATVSVVARNVALLYTNAVGFDPEQVNSISNTQGYEGGSLPSSRSIGFNINLKF